MQIAFNACINEYSSSITNICQSFEDCRQTLSDTHLCDNSLLESDIVFISTFCNDVNKIVGKNKGNSFPLHTKLALKIPKEVAKVNVKKL